MIEELYNNQEATVRTEHGNTEWFNIGRGVRQGCILSPYLFNIYSEAIIRNTELDELNVGVNIGGRKINNLRYADDTTLITTTEKKDLRTIIRRIKEHIENAGLFLNIKKTKIMSTTNLQNFRLNNENIEVVDSFDFLGSRIDAIGGSAKTKLQNEQ